MHYLIRADGEAAWFHPATQHTDTHSEYTELNLDLIWLELGLWSRSGLLKPEFLHGCPQEDERVPLGDILHLALQMEWLLRRLPHVLKNGFTTFSWRSRGYWDCWDCGSIKIKGPSASLIQKQWMLQQDLRGVYTNIFIFFFRKLKKLKCKMFWPVTVWNASSSMSSPPELAELLYWVRELLYSWSVPFISSTAFGSDGGRATHIGRGQMTERSRMTWGGMHKGVNVGTQHSGLQAQSDDGRITLVNENSISYIPEIITSLAICFTWITVLYYF